jgi:VanZ family protein
VLTRPPEPRIDRTDRRTSPWIDLTIWASAVGALGLTLWFSLGPAPDGPGTDRQLHALAYLVDTLAVLLAVVWRPGRGAGRSGIGVMEVALGMLALGGLIELAQGGFVHRDAQLADWAADAAGIASAVMVFGAIRWALRERRTRRLR